MKLCKATAGMGVPVSVSPNIGATCPFIIFETADIDSAVDGVIEAAFRKKEVKKTSMSINRKTITEVHSLISFHLYHSVIFLWKDIFARERFLSVCL